MMLKHIYLATTAFVTASLFMDSSPAFAQSHGSIYELIESIEGPPGAPAAAESLQARGPISRMNALVDTPEPISSFFVNVYDPSGSQPLTVEQNAALALSIGRGADRAEPPVGRENPDNPEIPAGFTFLGQFLDHDVTRNEMEALRRIVQLQIQLVSAAPDTYYPVLQEVLRNARSSLLDLDSVYGLSREQINQLVATIGDRPICTTPGDIGSGCFDASDLNVSDRRALAAMELDDSNNLTGRFEISFRASGPDGPVSADLPRCGDKRRFLSSPACIPNEGQGETIADVIHRALIGDGRNDENVIIAQIHLIFLLAHNKLFDEAMAGIEDPTAEQKFEAFNNARRTLINHWQALVMDDYLTEHVGRSMVDSFRTGDLSFYAQGDGQPYCVGEPGAMPHEFAVGAFRHGHSQVRSGYLLNTSGGQFNAAGFGALFGDANVFINRVVDFRHFFENVSQFDPTTLPDRTPTPSQKIDTVLSPPLARLLAPSIPKPHIEEEVLGELAARNLARVGGEDILQPDGDVGIAPIPLLKGLEVANRMMADGIQVQPLTDADVATIQWDNLPAHIEATPGQITFLEGITAADLPLWAYTLAEAEIQKGGEMLGDVGGRIVAETLIGLIRCDENGILAGGGSFTPSMVPGAGLVEAGHYRMADLINFALE